MNQLEKRALASEIVGDGKAPNKFFVTSGPWISIVDEYGDQQDSELLDGYEATDSITEVFDTYEEANEYYKSFELDIYEGVSQIILEDRLTGTIKEISLQKVIKVDYVEREHSDAKLFGYEK